jgi:hypothetical protein
MRKRHRSPELVSMWMLDVFCCALGCVTLLWLINSRTAVLEGQAARAEAEKSRQLNRSLMEREAELQSLLTKQKELIAALSKESTAVRLLTNEKAKLALDLDEATRLLTDLREKLALLESESDKQSKRIISLETDLDKKTRQLVSVELELAKTNKRAVSVETDLAKITQRALAAEAERDQAIKRARAAEFDLSEARSKLDKLAMDRTKGEFELRAEIKAIEGKYAALVKEAQKLKRSLSNRFEGIPLTGRNVVFLVDKSGSMKESAPDIPDPDKWPLVLQTLLQLLQSLEINPEGQLRNVQVILFSNKVEPLFKDVPLNRWLPYEPEKTAKRIQDAWPKEPEGGTRMDVAFEAAFALRKHAEPLDTIYFLSDGLPNIGMGASGQFIPNSGDDISLANDLCKHILDKLAREWNASPRPGAERPVRINCVGFYYGDPTLGSFLWTLSRENNGRFVGMSGRELKK